MTDPEQTLDRGSRASAPAGADLLPGAIVDGKYRIDERLGSGGMGVVVGPAQPELARFLERLGTATLMSSGDVARARPLFERSLTIREKVLGGADQELTDSIVGLASCERLSGRPAQARALFERALALNRRPDGSYHPLAQGALHYYAAMLREQHETARAEELEAMEISLMEEARRQGG